MLDKFKSLFVVPEDDNKKPEKKEAKKTSESKPSTTNKSTSKVSKPQAGGSQNEKIMNKLLTVLSNNNMEGFDYIEYKNSIKALGKLQMDEKTKYRSAFATAQTIGVTVHKLIESISFYQKVLAKENDDFLTALNHQVSMKVGDKKKEMEDYSRMIEEKKAQIQSLNKEIAKHEELIKGLNSKIEEDTVSINDTRKDFETTYYNLMHQINEDASKIKEYLQ